MRLIALIALLLAPLSLHAAWRDLKLGDDAARVTAAIGEPLLVSRSRGFENWIYDRGGTVEFEDGRVVYWQASQPDPEPAKSAARR